MSHAAPASGGTRTGRPPDVFGEGVHTVAKWAVPVVLGLLYGYWAAANRRFGGPVTGWNLLFGFVTALAFVVLYTAVRSLTRHRKRELRALLWAAFAGAAIGFLYIQTNITVAGATVLALLTGAGVFLLLFYRYYTQEDGDGGRAA
ncbi:hypothetical protein GCM10010129_38000 [Streptomyces fumigatiscleroticus]|nr:hypothetical protein GCM10010129_38000 [Streptomyces fumigatiscleroticus]